MGVVILTLIFVMKIVCVSLSSLLSSLLSSFSPSPLLSSPSPSLFPSLPPSLPLSQAKLSSTRVDGALAIQRAWKRYKVSITLLLLLHLLLLSSSLPLSSSSQDRQVFNRLQTLINFQRRGDPAYLLRCINPQEV